MGYVPTQEEVIQSYENANSLRERYWRANRILERRIRQLSKKGCITIHPEIQHIFDNRDGNNHDLAFEEGFVCRSGVISMFHGIKGTVQSSNDPLVKQIYEECQRLRNACEIADNISIGRESILQEWLEQEELDVHRDQIFSAA